MPPPVVARRRAPPAALLLGTARGAVIKTAAPPRARSRAPHPRPAGGTRRPGGRPRDRGFTVWTKENNRANGRQRDARPAPRAAGWSSASTARSPRCSTCSSTGGASCASSPRRTPRFRDMVWEDLASLGTGIRYKDASTLTKASWPGAPRGLIQSAGAGLWPSHAAAASAASRR